MTIGIHVVFEHYLILFYNKIMNPIRKSKPRWSQNISYAVGLLATDGCLYNDGRHIDFTSKDIQLIKTFKACLNLKKIKLD
ncbi:hypothetical protein KJ786_03805 [Patescibacteria group bacterium]|nr:hypothetical protein [Patescibacteria group bacterium]